MKVFRNLILIAFSTLASSAFAAEQVEGSYNGMTFTATIYQNVAAVISWHDNGEQMQLTYNNAPNPRPRCICDVYEAGSRRLTVEKYFGTQIISQVTYSKSASVAKPTYEYSLQQLLGRWYRVALASDLSVAAITGEDGRSWTQLNYNAELSSHFRCICRVYGDENNSIPLVYVETGFGGAEKTVKLLAN